MNPRAVRARLAQNGETVTVKKPANNTTDDYGKSNAGSWEVVGDENVIRSYREGGSGTERVTGGTVRRDQPRIFCKESTAIQAGYRLEFTDGSVYEATAPTHYSSHSEFTLTDVQ